MADLIQKPQPTGDAFMDGVEARVYQKRMERRSGVTPSELSRAKESFTEFEESGEDKPKPGFIDLGSGYVDDINGNYDLTEQAYQDQNMGTSRPEGQVSNQFLLPGRKTVHGIDIVTGERIFNRDSGIPEAEQHFENGVNKIGRAQFEQEAGYTSDDGIGGLVEVAQGTSMSDGGYAEYRRNLDLLHVPEPQKQAAWQEGQRRHAQEEIAATLDYAESTQEAEPPPLPDIEADQLPGVEGWSDAAQALYEAEEGEPFAGTDQQLVDWYVEEMSSFNWKIGVPGINSNGMAYYMSRALEEGPEYAKNLLALVDTYDRVNTSWGIVGENIKNLAQDPVSYLGVPGGAAAGRVVGGAIAKKAMKSALGKLIAAGAGAGAIDTGVETAYSDYAGQNIEKAAGYRDELDPAQTLGMYYMGASIGAPIGATAAVALPFASKATANAVRRMRRNALKTAPRGPMGRQIGSINPGDAVPFAKDSLLVQHKLTDKNLRHASKMGGLPMPSIGIGRMDIPIEGYGDITLIGDSSMAIPKARNPVYSADAYSPNYPPISYKFKRESIDALNSSLSKYTERTGSSQFYTDSLENGAESLSQSPSVMAKYLDEKGVSLDFIDSLEGYRKESALRRKIDDMGRGEYEEYATDMFNNLGGEERLFFGFTNLGNRRYKPHTLENVVKLMKEELKDNNQTSMYGSGALRAQVAPRFRKLAEVKAARRRIKPPESLDAIKEGLNDRLLDVSSKFDEFSTYSDSNPFFASDVTRERLLEIAQGYSTYEEYFPGAPESIIREWESYLADLKNAPTGYFEAKPQRTVALDEFGGALIPESATEETVKLLKRNGIDRIERYSDEADRAAKMKKFKDMAFTTALASILYGQQDEGDTPEG